MFKTLLVLGSAWMNEEGRVIKRIDLKPIAKVWVKFLKSRLMPTTHTIAISHNRLTIDVGKIIEKEIRDFATKKQKSAILIFLSLIMSICEASRVKFEANDEWVKNEGAITARKVERIAGESIATVTLECPAITRPEQATKVENMPQALSEAVHTCVQAQMEENMRFWTYLQNLEAQKYQYTLYIKSKDAEFLDLLLQQFNFREADEATVIKESKDATA